MSFRVFYLSKETKVAFQSARVGSWTEFSGKVVREFLPGIVEEFRELREVAEGGSSIKLPLDEETLQALSLASEELGLPQQLLMRLVAKRATEAQGEPRKTPPKPQAKPRRKAPAKRKPAPRKRAAKK